MAGCWMQGRDSSFSKRKIVCIDRPVAPKPPVVLHDMRDPRVGMNTDLRGQVLWKRRPSHLEGLAPAQQ